MRFRFGQCVLDLGSRELIRGGVRQDLSPKAFQLLALLLEVRPRALAKPEIHDRLWPDSFVSDSSLPRLATEIRDAIGDDAKDSQLLRTVHRYGYSFCGAVSVETPLASSPPSLVPVVETACRLVWGDRHIPLPPGESVLGRSSEARVFIDHARVSRQHARIVVTDGKATLEDLGSRNGTFHRGQRLARPAVLDDGDEIGIGPVLLVFRMSAGNSTTESSTAG